jgi:hypothetical protein
MARDKADLMGIPLIRLWHLGEFYHELSDLNPSTNPRANPASNPCHRRCRE